MSHFRAKIEKQIPSLDQLGPLHEAKSIHLSYRIPYRAIGRLHNGKCL